MTPASQLAATAHPLVLQSNMDKENAQHHEQEQLVKMKLPSLALQLGQLDRSMRCGLLQSILTASRSIHFCMQQAGLAKLHGN